MQKSGIYKIQNLTTGKFYIGSTKNFRERKYRHFRHLSLNKHHSLYLQNSYNKYGKDSFVFEVLAHCPPEYLIKLEQWFLDNLKPEYNVSVTANCFYNFGYKHTEETRKKISKANKGKKKPDSYLATRIGVPRTEETRKKISESNMGRIHSSNTIEKIINSTKFRCKPVLQYDMKDNFIKEWRSQKLAATTLKLKVSRISECAHGKRKQEGQFKWKYKEDETIN